MFRHLSLSPLRRSPYRLVRPAACVVLALTLAGCEGAHLPMMGRSLDSLLPPHSTLEKTQPATALVPEPLDAPPPPPPAFEVAGKGRVGGVTRRDRLAPLAGDAVSFDFVDADITAVARSILGDTLHLTYTIDPRVAGKVTLQTSAPIGRDEVLPLLEDAFQMNGAAIVEANGRVEVVPAEAAKNSLGITRVGGTRGPGWRTQIVPLRFTSAAQLQKSLEMMVPTGTSVHADAAHNALILTGSGTEIANLMDAVTAFDTDAMTGKSFGLWPLQVSDAATLATELESVFGHAETADDAAPVRFLPIRRLNAMLVIARDATLLHQARDWITRLDQIGDGNETQLYIYRVKSGRASYLADLLGKLYPDEVVEKVGSENGRKTEHSLAHLSASAPSTSAGPSAAPGQDAFVQVPSPIKALGVVEEAAAKSGQANGIALTALPGDTGAAPKGNGIRIIADTVNNTLLIQARPAFYRRIEKSLNKLDVIPSQVSVEATIVEVTLNNTLRFGTQFFLNSGKSSFKFTPNSDGTVGAIAPGFSYIWAAGGGKAVLDVLRGVTDVSVVSSPTMMMMDNETAQLQVGDQVPVITSTSQSALTAGAPVISQVEYHDTGVILAVTPRITGGGTVLLDIQQEVSDVVSTTTSNIDSPSFQRRRFHSSVAVMDGQTLALGGLISNGHTKNSSGVPWLSEIPVVGLLFGDRSDSTKRTELLVLITPHVVRNQAEAAAATEEIRRRIQDTVSPEPSVLP